MRVKQIVNIQKNKEEQIRQDIRINVKSAWIRHHEALDRVQALILSVRQAEELPYRKQPLSQPAIHPDRPARCQQRQA